MCKKSIYKKNFLLCTIAGTLIFSHFCSTYANALHHEIPEIPTVRTANGEKITLNNVFVRGKYNAVIANTGHITITNSIMHSDGTLLAGVAGGYLNAKGIVGKTKERGLSLTNGIINVQDSIIHVTEHGGAYGIIFDYILSSRIKEGEEVVNKAILSNTKLLVKDGVGIVGPYYSKAISNEVQLKDSEIHSDMLLKNKTAPGNTEPATFILTADNSIMEGKVKTLPQNTTVFNLNNNSKWYLKISLFEVEDDSSIFDYKLLDIKQRAQSVVSVLNLNNSSIVFNAPHVLANGHYQTLSVGRVQTAEVSRLLESRDSTIKTVYNATGDAKIYFNTEWSDGLQKEKQKTDRLLIHGNVSGTTTIYINNLSKDENAKEEYVVPLNMRGISLIQVSGKADENSFKLANGYTTIKGLPYKYTLNAYGPTSSHGKADSAQSHLEDISQESKENTPRTNTNHLVLGGMVVEIEQDIKGETTSNREKANAEQNHLRENKNFWDFRLQTASLDAEGKIRALVPQVASYLVMPNALFSTGLADLNNQNIL
ncbi:autotransporter outer membrane beta-barrel domain-containing protein, partial [Bartonella koehlerae]|uniref:autotransporter outer membrane beta-barrel domain-containing protein n=1 Tax=Bartonella koehlerae TaxID=92181 RepID=UPI001ABB94B8